MGSSESKQTEIDKLELKHLKKTDTPSSTLGGTLLGKQTDRIPELHRKAPAPTFIPDSPHAAASHEKEKGIAPHLAKNFESPIRSKDNPQEKIVAKGPQSDYFKLKNEYEKQHSAYEQSLDQYWNSISSAANASPRRFISEFPPLYQGPPAPTLHSIWQQHEVAAPMPAKHEFPSPLKPADTAGATKPATSEATKSASPEPTKPPALDATKPPTVEPIKPASLELAKQSFHKSKNPDDLPSINDIVASSKHLLRFASNNKAAQDFKIDETDEASYKQRYAVEALKVGEYYGIKPQETEQVVKKVYAFEDGGWGTRDTWSSMPESMTSPDRPGDNSITNTRRDYHPRGVGSSSALGYNQMLTPTTLDNVRLNSAPMVSRLEELAKEDPSRAKALTAKAEMLTALAPFIEKELRAMANEDARKPAKDRTKAHYLNSAGEYNFQLVTDFSLSRGSTSIGISRRDLAQGIEALNLDSDIGPIIQAGQLRNIFNVAQQYSFQSMLDQTASAAKSASDRYDALAPEKKEKAVHQLLSLASSSSDDIVEQQTFEQTKGQIEKKLLALAKDADPEITDAKMTEDQSQLLRNHILTLKRYGEKGGPLPAESRDLLDKISYSYFGGITGDKLLPAAVELANLTGLRSAISMLDPANSELPTSNFFARSGYEHNPVVYERSSNELLMFIDLIMSGSCSDPAKHDGIAAFDKSFQSLNRAGT